MKLSKIMTILAIVVIALTVLATTVNAAESNANEDLRKFLTGKFTINNVTYQASEQSVKDLNQYLKNHTVTSAQVKEIKDLVNSAVNGMVAAGHSGANGVDPNAGYIKDVITKLEKAAKVLGLEATVDSANGTYTVKGKNLSVSGKINSAFTTYGPDGKLWGSQGSVTAPTTGSAAGAASTAKNGSKVSTVSGFAKTGSTVSIFSVATVIAVVAVSTYFVKKVNA